MRGSFHAGIVLAFDWRQAVFLTGRKQFRLRWGWASNSVLSDLKRLENKGTEFEIFSGKLKTMSEHQVPEQSDFASTTDAPQMQEGSPEARRRRLLQGGLAAAPVVLTLFSRSALGGGGYGGGGGGAPYCDTPSGFISGNASYVGTTQNCSGKKPSYWCQSQSYSYWRAPCYPTTVGGSGGHQATKYHSSATGFNGSQFGTKTMMQVMQSGSTSSYTGVGCYVAAALLNAKQGWTPILSETAVRGIWNEYVSKGYYEASAGIKWYADEIINYLQTTMQG